MSEADAIGAVPLGTPGTRLRAARKRSGQSLADIAARTRIPQRHLEAIERDEYDALPSTTYSVGFARAYARTVGDDEVAVAAAVRAQLDGQTRARHDFQAFEPADPARVPPRTLAWVAAVIAVLLLGTYGIWRATLGAGSDPQVVAVEPAAAPRPAPKAAPAPATAPPAGPVLLTATDAVWIKVTDASGASLVQRELKPGETYQVPPGTPGPKLTFSRPEALTVSVGGVPVPPLGPPARLVKNALLTPEALRARTPTP